MKNRNVLGTLSIVLLFSGGAWAQEGFGLQTYTSSVRVLDGFILSALGVGGGVNIYKGFVVSVSAYLTSPPAYSTASDGTSYRVSNKDTVPLEFGASVAYRFLEDNPTLYVLAGYSYYPPGGPLNREIRLIHAGIGLAPFKGWFDLYPELSIAIPFDPHLTTYWQYNPELGKYYTDHAHVPVMFRLTLKAYFDP